MGAMTDTLENKMVNWFFRGQALGLNGASAGAGSGPTNLYIGLMTTTPADGSAGVEVSGGNYARVAVASTLANWAGTQGAGTTVASSGTGGTTSNNNAITFPVPSANWGTITGVGIFDTLTGGIMTHYAALGTSKTVNNGDPAPSFAAGQLSYQIDN